jgi:hypothetical protein
VITPLSFTNPVGPCPAMSLHIRDIGFQNAQLRGLARRIGMPRKRIVIVDTGKFCWAKSDAMRRLSQLCIILLSHESSLLKFSGFEGETKVTLYNS